MTPSPILELTSRIFTRWHNAGVSFSALSYVEGLGKLGNSGRLDELKKLAQNQNLFNDASFEEVAVCAWTGTPDWKEQVVRRLLLPRLEAELQESQPDLVRLLNPWTSSTLSILLMPEHIRILTNRSLAQGPLRLEQAKALLELVALSNRTPPDVPLNVDNLEFWKAALRFWKTDEMIPAMLVLLSRPLPGANPPQASTGKQFVQQLTWIMGILQHTGWNAIVIRERLLPALQAMMAACVDDKQPVTHSGLYCLLSYYKEIFEILSPASNDPRPSSLETAIEWYHRVAACLEECPEPARQCLRRVWGRDVALALSGDPIGVLLIKELYQVWSRTSTSNSECRNTLAKALVDVRLLLGVDPTPIITSMLRNQIQEARSKQELIAAARNFLETHRIISGPMPPFLRSLLLARLPDDGASFDADGRILADWNTAKSSRERAIVTTAKAMAGNQLSGIGWLLWEILLSPPARLSVLRRRVSQALEQAHEEPGSLDCINALCDLLKLLHEPTP